MKFTLIIWVCSFLGSQGSCLAPMEYPKEFNSWYECSRTAHIESVKLLESFDLDFVNKNQVGMKYSCKHTMMY